jgi:hypothetical protein
MIDNLEKSKATSFIFLTLYWFIPAYVYPCEVHACKHVSTVIEFE